MVNVAHDGHYRRTSFEVFFFVVVVGRNVETEAFEKLTLFVFRRNHFNLVSKFLAQNLHGLFV